MRTTLEIEDDVLQAVREIATKERTTVGAVISRLVREQLQRFGKLTSKVQMKNGVPIFPARPGEIITPQHVQRLMDEEEV